MAATNDLNRPVRPVRVLLLASSLHYGGAERQIVELARHLDRRRFEPVLCCLDGKTTLARELSEVPVVVLTKERKFDLLLIPRVMNILSDWKIEIVHSFLFDAELLGRVCGRLKGLRAVVASERNSSYPRMPLHETLQKLTRPLWDVMIANSWAGREHNRVRLHVPGDRIRVVHNGVDAERFRPHDVSELRASLGLSVAPMVGMFASFKPQKNHEMYLRVARRVLQEVPNARFLFVAHNPSRDPVSAEHRSKILSMIEELGIGDRCVHLVDRSDMQDLYCLCDLTVLTSVREGTPNVVLESMASGVPVIATDVADNAKIIGDAGGVALLNDVEAMAQRVVGILKDTSLRQKLSDLARERAVREFSLEQLARKTEAVYLEALRRRSPIRYRQLNDSQSGSGSDTCVNDEPQVSVYAASPMSRNVLSVRSTARAEARGSLETSSVR